MYFLLISLLLGGAYLGIGGRTPMFYFFDLVFIVTLLRMAWNLTPINLSDKWVFGVGILCLFTQMITALANLTDIYKSLYFLKTFVVGLIFYGIACSCRYKVRPAAIALFLAGFGAVVARGELSGLLSEDVRVAVAKGEFDLGFVTSNFAASFLILALPIVIVFAFQTTGRKRLFYGGCAIIGSAGLLLTFCRGAIFALLAATVASIGLMVRAGLRIRRLFTVTALAAVACAMLLSRVDTPVLMDAYGYFTEQFDVGDQNRMDLWNKAIATFTSHPVLGIGPGQFVNYTEDVGFWGFKLNAHNSYLQALAEMGVVGSLPLFGLLGLVAWRTYKHAHDTLDPVAIAIWVAIFAGLLHNVVESTLYSLHFQILFWSLAAIAWRNIQARHRPHQIAGIA